VPRLLGWDADRMQSRSDELLAMVALDPADYAHRLPEELSGGQQQRVGVARALAADPKYLLMDEPFGALDAVTRDDLQNELLRVKKRLGKTIVFVTHDIFEAMKIADRIAVLHDGRVEQIGSAEDLTQRPATDFVKNLFARPIDQLADFQEMI
jgi:osmoprotectant transport system ATP-binding protein